MIRPTIKNETTPREIAANQARIQEAAFISTLTVAQTAITDAAAAVTAVEGAASLAEAQTAVTGIGDALGDANDAITSVLP